jgi:hypothetical protein
VSDDQILEYFDAHGIDRIRSIDTSEDLNYQYETLRRRAKIRSKPGLVEAEGNGVYRITGEGTEYLAGTQILRDLEEPE